MGCHRICHPIPASKLAHELVVGTTFYGAAQGVTYGAETSTDCQNWVPEGVTISELDPANMRTATVNRDGPRRFLRLTFGMGP